MNSSLKEAYWESGRCYGCGANGNKS